MKPPARVTIGPHEYEVRCDAETQKLMQVEGNRGDSRTDHHLIRLRAGHPHTAMAEVLLHEIFHCLWDQTPMRAESYDTEERTITALCEPLLDTLRRNPKLVTYLLARA